jgi:hypothetical protein
MIETPYEWCKRLGAEVGDGVRYEEDEMYIIDSIDDEMKKITRSDPGVFSGVEWQSMQPGQSRTLVKAAGFGQGEGGTGE